ncbi:MAG: Acyltransferase family [Variovorax sp.]|nr:Acyltransferase family [Variovorax sp.]
MAVVLRRSLHPHKLAQMNAPPQSMKDDRRYLGLDLARSTAIGLVLVCHGCSVWQAYFGLQAPNWLLMTGSFGVELFFVLSGFLIGGILLELIEKRPTFREWGIFMIRRWMRTLPLYFAWLLVMALWDPPPAGQVAIYLQRYALLLQNFAWPMPADNWFAVSWSLAVEEWFYLLFSAFLFLAARLIGARRAAWAVTGAFIVIPFLLRFGVVEPSSFMTHVYKTVLYHLDAIAYGVVVALLQRQGSVIFVAPYRCLALGLATVLLCWGRFSGAWGTALISDQAFLTWFSALTSIGFALCFPATLKLRTLPRVIESAVLQLSKHSYGVYVIHLTVLSLFNYQIVGRGLNPWIGMGLAVVMIAWLAAASWKMFEEPILRARPRQLAKLSPTNADGPAQWIDLTKVSG